MTSLKAMPDLYAINLHLQKRLERDWLEGVRAVETAHPLDETCLLQNQTKSILIDPEWRLLGVAVRNREPG